MIATINSTVGYELTCSPRATRGSAQNLFRAAYQMLRASSLGPKGALERIRLGLRNAGNDDRAAEPRKVRPGLYQRQRRRAAP
jgi:hypothetical protein